MASFGSIKSAIFDREEKQQYQSHIHGLNAYKFLNDYGQLASMEKKKTTDVKLPVKTDHDTLREGHRIAPPTRLSAVPNSLAYILLAAININSERKKQASPVGYLSVSSEASRIYAENLALYLAWVGGDQHVTKA
ncbi:Cellulose synthase family protein isoform 1 [Hibiscus syriacus]|uniref:Cellulose synthase family protein isoform 1 n=1 Tax=Hibiscus syriacus TaxID=106335 RepID=A0A6A2YLH9_HIBSY|nr:Cellulose synthase family protein isoform 1 [Hibiscus syriacus]